MLRLNFLTRSMLILCSSAIGWASWYPSSQAGTLTNSESFTGIYQFEDSLNPTVTGNGISFSPWKEGVGIPEVGYAAGKNRAAGKSRIGDGNWTKSSTPDADDYFQFSLTPAAGSFFDITSIGFDAYRSATGPQNWQLNAQIGSQPTIILSQGINPNSIWNAFTIAPPAALSNLTQAVTFTLYGYGATGTGNSGTWRIDNFAVSGVVSAITTPKNPGSATPDSEPDAVPTPILLPALLGFGLKLRQRCERSVA